MESLIARAYRLQGPRWPGAAPVLAAAMSLAILWYSMGTLRRIQELWGQSLPQLPYFTSTHLPPAIQPVVPVAPVARAAWQAPEGTRVAFPQVIERWRPTVRELLAEAWSEGRLDGKAATLDDDLVLAVIQHESSGNPNAYSWAGAIGLMQVMPFTFAEMMHGHRSYESRIDPAAPWDVNSNVRAGIRYLALAMQAHEGNIYWSLASYNAGIETVGLWRAAGLYAVPPVGGYTETAAYAPKIMRTYLRSRPGISLHVPDAMPAAHVQGALRQIRDAQQRG